MGSPKISWFLLLSFILASMIPNLTANVAEWDEYWLKKKAEAEASTKKVFDDSSNDVLSDLYKEKMEAKAKAQGEGNLGEAGDKLEEYEDDDGAKLKAKAEAPAEAKPKVKGENEAEELMDKAKVKTDGKEEDEDESEIKAKTDEEDEDETKLKAKAKHNHKHKVKSEDKKKSKAKAKPTHKKTKIAAKSKHLDSTNSTRRELRGRKYSGPCMATNGIDRCWRCDKKWALNRRRLADCAQGFGQKAVGGKYGRIYIVTDSSDYDVVNPKPGTLRHAVIQLEPLWIIFARSMTIKLSQELIMTSYKTIDARGANVHIAYGAGITIQFVHNIIIHNLHIHDIVETSGGMVRDSVNHAGFRTHNEGDGISVFGSRDVWLDHLSMSRCKDGLIDAVQGSTAITISNSHFTDHDKVMLFGASDYTDVDDKMQITVAYNHFGKRLVQRMPRCRSGFFHLVNNDYTHWEMYAIGGSHHATIISQGNRFIAPPNLSPNLKSMLEITHRDPSDDWRKWTWVSDGDIFKNGAFFIPSGDPNGARTYAALELIKPAPALQVGQLTMFAGALACSVGVPC